MQWLVLLRKSQRQVGLCKPDLSVSDICFGKLTKTICPADESPLL